ncbi:MAG: hypothetical protein IKC47_04805 [Clostridia bacterium]|nr:hypothetical protein [Clostridia bacterium]
MKKLRLVALLLVAIMVVTALSACAALERTVTVYNGEEKIAEVIVKKNKKLPTEYEGWFLDGNLYATLEDYQKANDDDAENDPEAIKLDEFKVKEDMAVYGTFIEDKLATGTGYTYTYAMDTFPTVWNPLVYQTATDAEILDYVSDGFYTFDYNETKTGYQMVPAMAVGEPVDVTAQYANVAATETSEAVDKGWGIEEGAQYRAWKITIRNDLKWDDGTPITANDFVESVKRLLDPAAQNSRADDYTYAGKFVMHNAELYLKQGMKGWFPASDVKSTYTAEDDAALKFEWFDKDSDATAFFTDYLSGYDYDGTNCFSGFGSSEESVGATYAQLSAMSGMTIAEIKANEEYATALANLITWWDEGAEGIFDFTICEHTYPELSFDKVGIKAVSDTEIVYILDQELKGFYLKYSLPGILVKTSLYDSLATTSGGVYSNSYGTTVATTPSFGAYKLTYFQKNKSFKLEKNTEWYGHADHPDLYQTTNVNVIRVANAATRLQMFLAGQLDSYGLTVNDMAEYQMSDYTYYTTGESTFFMALNPNLEVLEEKQEAAGTNINKTILTVKEFRQALSFALDRAKFALATSPTNNPSFAAFSTTIVANPETGETYRATEEAKDAVLAFWGLADDVGEGKRYATKDDAIASITGYDLAGAKTLFDAAYDKAIAEGLMDADDVVEIKIGLPSATAAFYTKGYDFLVNNYTEAVKGTKLEGKLTFSKDDTIGNGFGDALRNNQVDLLFGVGFTGSALDPYGLVGVYSGNDESLRYDKGTDTTQIPVEVTVAGLVAEHEGAKTYTASMDAWTKLLEGKQVTVAEASDPTKTYTVKVDAENYAVKLPILAAIEKAVLEQYNMIPIIDDSRASLKGQKYNYYTEDYIYGVGRGGIKYRTYNYNDSEWAAYVESKGGILNYK